MSRRAIALLALAVAAGPAAAESVDQTLAAAERAVQDGDPRAAIARLEARLAEGGPDAELLPLRGAIGNSLMLVNEPAEALGHFDWIVARAPDHARAHFERAGALERMGRMNEAIDAYARARSAGHPEPEALARIGFCHRVLAGREATPEAQRARHELLAAQALSRAIQLDPRNRSALGNLADLAFNAGNHRGALVLYERMDELEPDTPTTLARLGSTLARLGRHEAALVRLRRAAELAETAVTANVADQWVFRDAVVFARIRIGESLLALGRHTEARAELERVVALSACPECPATTAEMRRAESRARALLDDLEAPVPAAPRP